MYMNCIPSNWDEEMFDIYNGDRKSLDDIEADYWDELDQQEVNDGSED